MYCQRCQKRPATVHITKVVNQQKTEEHLCESCAQEHSDIGLSFSSNFPPIQQLFFSLLNQPDLISGKVSVSPGAAKKCLQCETSYAQFSQEGKFGCSECYEGFGEQLEHLLRRIHGNARHYGKVPRRGGKAISEKRQLEELRAELKMAIKQEEFERAAMLRDQIREMEERVAG